MNPPRHATLALTPLSLKGDSPWHRVEADHLPVSVSLICATVIIFAAGTTQRRSPTPPTRLVLLRRPQLQGVIAVPVTFFLYIYVQRCVMA